MKKSLILVGMLAIGFAKAQEGTVGINTSNPKATLDIQPNATNLTGTTNEGIIAPRLSKTRIANIEASKLTEGTLVYATDEATSPISAYAGTDAKVAKITEKGYYFYNGTEWVKAGANGELWAQRDNNGVTETYLKPANEKTDFIGYRSDRKWSVNLGNIQDNDFNYQSTDTNATKGLAMSEVPLLTAISSDVLPERSTVGANNKFFFSHNNSLLKESHASKNPTGRYYGKEDRLVIKDITSTMNNAYGFSGVVDLHSNNTLGTMIGVQGLSIAGTENGVYSDANVTNVRAGMFGAINLANTTNIEGIRATVRNYKKADNLMGGFFSTISQSVHNGQVATHTIENLQGIKNEVRLAPNGTINKMFAGIYSNQYISADTTFGTENEIRGIYSHTDIQANANVDTNYVNVISTNTLYEGSYVKTLMDFGTYPRMKAGARVGKYTGVNISAGEIDKAAEIDEMIGLRIANINKGKQNYAIHTSAGKVRVGDLAQTGAGDRLVYADANGVLKTGSAANIPAVQVGSTTSMTCDDANRGKMNFVKDVDLGGGKTADAFAVCLKGSDGKHYWRYLYGGAGMHNGTETFGTGLQ